MLADKQARGRRHSRPHSVQWRHLASRIPAPATSDLGALPARESVPHAGPDRLRRTGTLYTYDTSDVYYITRCFIKGSLFLSFIIYSNDNKYAQIEHKKVT